MRNRRKTADGYERWLMKVSSTGAAAFNDIESVGGAGGRARGGEDGENGESDQGEDDEDEEARKNRPGMKKGTQAGDEDGEEPARHIDLDDDEPEKGIDPGTVTVTLLVLGLLFGTISPTYCAFCSHQGMTGSMRRTSQMMMKQLGMKQRKERRMMFLNPKC